MSPSNQANVWYLFFLQMSVKFANMWRHADLTNFFHLGILARKTFHKHWKRGLARKKCTFVSIWRSILFLNSNSARISYLYSKMLSWLTYFKVRSQEDSWNPTIFNIIRCVAVSLGRWNDHLIDQASDVPSIIISCKIRCKNPFN